MEFDELYATHGNWAPARLLDGFQADFSFLPGIGFANPYYAATGGAGRVFIEDKFNHLAAPQWKISAQAETFLRRIED
jgi:hypothetical protein